MEYIISLHWIYHQHFLISLSVWFLGWNLKVYFCLETPPTFWVSRSPDSRIFWNAGNQDSKTGQREYGFALKIFLLQADYHY